MATVNIKPMNQLQYAQPVSSTDEFVICQTPGGCGSNNSLLRITMANLAAFILSTGNTGVLSSAIIDVSVSGDHIMAINTPASLPNYIITNIYVADPPQPATSALLNFGTGPNQTGTNIAAQGINLTTTTSFNQFAPLNISQTLNANQIYMYVRTPELQLCPLKIIILGFFLP